MRPSDVDPADYHLVVDKPDASFSPQRNYALIEQTLKETEAFFDGLKDLYKDDLENRIDIIASYGNYRLNRGNTKALKEYLGKEQWEAVIGEKILSKVRVFQSAEKLHKQQEKKILL